MYIETVPNRNSPPALLLRQGWREGGKTRKRTLANLSHWPKPKIETLRRLLRDETLVSPQDLFTTRQTLPHGHVEALLAMIRQLGLESVIASKRCRERDLVVAMIVERLIAPASKLAMTRDWHTTTLAEELGVEDATEDDLYEAMDWLGARKERIEKKLAERHLKEGGLVLYDVTSRSYEGRTCRLAQFGHNRDGDKKLPIIVYGVMTDGEGRPIGVEVYPGNTGDPTTVGDQVEKLRERLGLERVVLVGDRGRLTQSQIDKLQKHSGFGWITALTSGAIRELVQKGALQLSLLDQKNLAEITSPESIEPEAKRDGIYVLRTSEAAERLSAEDTVRSYKSLAEVERAFRCLKGIDLWVWPIRHRTEDRVPAPIFLCRLAYYVEWHLRRAWAPLLFEDEERREERPRRDPILPAHPSASAQTKKRSHQTAEGLPVHSFETLLAELASRARVTYALQSQDPKVTFKQVPTPTPRQARAYELIRSFPVAGK